MTTTNENNLEENKGWEETTNETDERRQAMKFESMREETNEVANHEYWLGTNMGEKGKSTGLRIATNNFQRKLYANDENIIETIQQCETHKIDMIIATEPGQGTIENRIRLKNALRQYGYGLVTVTRDNKTIGGGLAVILGPKWAKIPYTRHTYNPEKRENRGRVMALTFDNKLQGQHNKIQIIGVHGLNAAEAHVEETAGLLTWIAEQKDTIEKENPMASTVLLGDLNATISTLLDTDRKEKEGRQVEDEEEEKDAFVIKEINKLRLTDLLRGRYPVTRATTRTSTNQTNRFLDKIFATGEIAEHPDTQIGIYKEQFLTIGSDHKMIMADIPVDTAGVAEQRVEIWEKRKIIKWVKDVDQMGKVDDKKIKEFNTRLESEEYSGRNSEEYIEWAMNAARGTILKQTVKMYPKRASTKPMYTPEDHKLRTNLRALRNIIISIEEAQDPVSTAIKARRRLKQVEGSIMTAEAIEEIIREVKNNKGNSETGK